MKQRSTTYVIWPIDHLFNHRKDRPETLLRWNAIVITRPPTCGCISYFSISRYLQTSNIRCTLVCNWSIACRRCSNYIFILETPGSNGLGRDNCKPRREKFKCWDLVPLKLEVWRYIYCKIIVHKILVVIDYRADGNYHVHKNNSIIKTVLNAMSKIAGWF